MTPATRVKVAAHVASMTSLSGLPLAPIELMATPMAMEDTTGGRGGMLSLIKGRGDRSIFVPLSVTIVKSFFYFLVIVDGFLQQNDWTRPIYGNQKTLFNSVHRFTI